MSITDTIKGVVFGKKQLRQQPVQIIEHQHHWVQPPPQPKTFSQKIESLRKSTDKFAKKHFTGKPVGYKEVETSTGTELKLVTRGEQLSDTAHAVSSGIGKAGRAVKSGAELINKASRSQPVTAAIKRIKKSGTAEQFGKAKASAEHFGQFIAPPTKKEVATMKATAQQRRAQVAPILSLMGGNADTYHKPVGTVKMGRRISKREAKRLRTLYGENWAQKLQKNTKGYYVQPTPADLAQARKERKLTANSVDFGHGFESMRTGMEVSLTRDMGNVVGDRESEDPFNIDARFSGASAGLGFSGTKRKSKNPYDINGNFNTGGFRL